MARLLYVVHRAWPYQGGSEIFVHNMAVESLSRGHEVAVLAGEHKGNCDGITITNDANILLQKWDLIIVHGADVNVQNFVLSNAKNIPNPILYMLILPKGSSVSIQAMIDCQYIGWSTHEDLKYINNHAVNHKAVNVRHGITPNDSFGKKGFKEKYNISGRMFLSCGGYWNNKAMKELADVFKQANLPDAVLVTTGYDNRSNLMPSPSSNVIPLLLDNRQDVLDAIYEADCYLMHSYVEGFGLVLLESMINSTPWIARHGSGAALLNTWGKTYTTDQELIRLLQEFVSPTPDFIESAKNYVMENHLIKNTVDDIEAVVLKNQTTL